PSFARRPRPPPSLRPLPSRAEGRAAAAYWRRPAPCRPRSRATPARHRCHGSPSWRPRPIVVRRSWWKSSLARSGVMIPVVILAPNAPASGSKKQSRSLISQVGAPPSQHASPVHPWSKCNWLFARPLDGAQILGGRLAATAGGHGVVGDLLALVEGAHPGAFDRADVHEDILVAIVRLNEAEALLAIEPLHGSLVH